MNRGPVMTSSVLPCSLGFLFSVFYCHSLAHAAAPSPHSQQICEVASQAQVPGVAVAILDKNSTEYVTCGMRDPAKHRPITINTVFEAASLSKVVFAFGVSHLVSSGELDLDKPLASYLPHGTMHDGDPFHHRMGTTEVNPELLQKISAREILTHTSGLPNWMGDKPLAQTGQQGHWQYSGEGFLLLQRAVEEITGKSLDKWIQASVFKPLKMRHSSFVWETRFSAQEAVGHNWSGNVQPAEHFPYAVAATTLYTTVRDYVTFVKAAFFDPLAYRFFITTQVPVDVPKSLYWGQGVAIERLTDSDYFLHGGGNNGFKNYLWYSPHSQRGFVFFSNGDNGIKLTIPFVKMLVPPPQPAIDSDEIVPARFR